MFFNLNKIMEAVKRKNRVFRVIVLILGTFLLAVAYNIFLDANNLVTGGVSGLAIICQKLFSINSTFFIYIFTFIILIVSFFTLGEKETLKSAFGAILYPLMVTFTKPLCDYIIRYYTLDSFIIEVLMGSLLLGFASGIVYKVGYSTGGNDTIVQIINKYAKIPVGKAVFASNLVIILLGGAIFGINNVAYAIIIVYIESMVVDKILLGISDSKQFFIHTKELNKVKELIIKKLNTGVTVIETMGGFTERKNKMLMCVVATKDYYLFKEAVLEIDPEAFFVINDCYEVSGGVKRSTLPFV